MGRDVLRQEESALAHQRRRWLQPTREQAGERFVPPKPNVHTFALVLLPAHGTRTPSNVGSILCRLASRT